MSSHPAEHPPSSPRLTCEEQLLLADAAAKLDFVTTSRSVPDWVRDITRQLAEDVRAVVAREGAEARLEEEANR